MLAHYQVKVDSIIAARERTVKETDILAELLKGADASFSLDTLDIVKQIKSKYTADVENALGTESDRLLEYALDTPEAKDEVCSTLLFEPSEQIIHELGLADQADQINEAVKELYMRGEEDVIDMCATAVQDHLDDIVDLDVKLGADQEETD